MHFLNSLSNFITSSQMFSTMLKTREITPIQSIISNSVDVLGLSVFLCASHIDLNSAIITNWRQDKNR